MPSSDRLCVCGHHYAAHEHFRKGTECSLCPAGACHQFRPASGASSVFSRLKALFSRS